MKGTIFNILESFICENFGDELFEEVLEIAHPNLVDKGPYIGPGTYPDQDFFQLVTVLLEKKGIEAEVGIRLFGQFCYSELLKRLPLNVRKFESPQQLLLSLNDVIHSEVKKLYEDAELPFFEYENVSDSHMRMRYISSRKLYPFVTGLIEGLSKDMEVPIQVDFQLEGDIGLYDLSFGV